MKAVHYKDPPKILIGYETERKMSNKIIQLGNIRKDSKNFTNPQTGRIYSVDGIAPTLNTCQGGDRQPKVLVNMKNIIDDTYGYEKSNRYME